MTTFLTDSLDINRFHFSSKLNLKQRSELGQFLTPAPVARFMAGQFNNLSGNINLLDPGAGIGSLVSAFVEQLLINSAQIESCLITTYEVEETFLSCLEECLIECCNALKNKGIKAEYSLRNESFIESIGETSLPLFTKNSHNFTHAIINPPYKKINNQSIEKKILSKLGIETVNLYSAFVWLSMLQLAQNGEIVAITPRSFCNGSYFRPFRKAFLEKMAFENIHIFESRSLAFAEDNVLQENIIFHAVKTENKPKFIEISINSEKELDNSSEKRLVPLIYPESIKPGKVLFPPKKPRKSIAIENNQQTQKWLIQPGWYVLIKRFSAKEEKRRIVAAVCSPLDSPALGIENHLNYYHAKGRGVNPDLARGLAAFLNSTLFDNYFRLFSGNTQVNVTDLRKIRYPSKEDLMKLGSQIDEFVFDQEKLDTLVHKNLSIMSEAINAIQASKRIQEALTILKQISAPKEQQNERSALCLLALADIRPETSWNQATTPKRRITEMMDWFRDFYGKQYAPNTRETVRRQTMHQFVQMGLVVENPDQLNRPINSPKWCYQLQQQALLLIQSYNSDQWEESRSNYAISVKNLLQDRTRNIPTITDKKENLS
jgi:adenine-specific DNA-methyltransferase